MINAVTVDVLALLVKDMQEKGMGKKKILISTDDEGNGYHELFFGFGELTEDFMKTYAPIVTVPQEKLKDYVLLG